MWVRWVRRGRRRTVIHTEATVDVGRDRVGGEDGVEEDGDVEEEVVLLVGGFGCLDVDVCEKGLHLDPGRCGWDECVG